MSDIEAIRARHHESFTWDSGNPRAGADHRVHWCSCSPGQDWPCDTAQVLAALAEREAEVDMGRLRLAVGILAGTGELRVNYKRDINKETMRIAAAIAREYAALADTPEPTP